jgi:putative ABC transport system substrate-binding protein
MPRHIATEIEQAKAAIRYQQKGVAKRQSQTGQKRTLIQELNCIIRRIGVAYSFNIRGTRLRGAGGWRQLSRQLRSQPCFQPIDVGQTNADTDEHPGHRVTSRRAFLAASIAATASPFVAAAQPPTKTWRIGYLGPVSPSAGARLLESFRQGLRELGYVEGQNISIDYRWAEGRPDRLPALAVELTQLKVDVIVAYSNAAVGALQKATRTVPIVFATVGDPVASGFAASLARPGGNITGITSLADETSRKWIELLREAVPTVFRVAVLMVTQNLAECSNQNCRLWQVIEGAAKAVKAIPQPHAIAGPDEIEHAFANLIKDRAQGLIVLPHAVTNANRARIVNLAAGYRLPGMYPSSEYVEAGGLMSYGPNPYDQHRRAATFVDKILKGAKPADLPIEQPTKFELVVNMKTAKTLGITIPQSLLLRADEVIQ